MVSGIRARWTAFRVERVASVLVAPILVAPVLAALFLASAVVPAAASEPIALVLAVDGRSEPAIEQFSELRRGAKLELARGTRLTFVHYNDCRKVTVRGGRLRLLGRSFDLRGGHVVSDRAVKCPQTLLVGGNGTVAGVMMRGAFTVRVPTEPSFALVGDRVERVRAVRIRRSDGSRTTLRLEARRAVWPPGAEPLDPGALHTLEVLWTGAEPVKFALDPARDVNVGAAILRVD